MKYAVEILQEVFGVGYRDLEKLEEIIEFASILKINWKDIIYFTVLPDENVEDRNYAMNELFSDILFNLMLSIVEHIKEKFDVEIETNFIINYMDTHFNNFLDEVMYKAIEGNLDKKEVYGLIEQYVKKEVDHVCR